MGLSVKNKKIIFVVLLLLLACMNSFLLIKFINPRWSAKVSLLEGEEYLSNVFTEYEEPGVQVKVGEKIIKDKDYSYKVEGTVNKDQVGDYILTYKVKYKNKEYILKRKVTVVDTIAPEINTSIASIEKDFCTNQIKQELTFSATDNVDGDITDKVERTDEENLVILTVSDSAGNKTLKEIPISYLSKPDDVIKINGNKTVYVVVGGKYEDAGAKATDGCGKSINVEIKTEGSVDTSKVGTYTITYSVERDGRVMTNTRTVKVIEQAQEVKNDDGAGKVVYLTFDDGPGAYTQSLLDILDKYPNVKVTFFVTNQFPKYQYLIGEEAKRGHTVAVHTYTHKWNVYTSVETYKDDFNKMNDVIEQQTGKRSSLFRFPGGSSNTISRNYAKGVVRAIANEMQNEGYVYFDWNVDSEDAAGAGTDKAYNNVIRGISRRNSSVVLMHDIHKTSIPAAERIIQYGLEHGYEFKGLTSSSPTAHHGINN